VAVTESIVEEAALGWLAELGYAIAYAHDLAPASRPASLLPI